MRRFRLILILLVSVTFGKTEVFPGSFTINHASLSRLRFPLALGPMGKFSFMLWVNGAFADVGDQYFGGVNVNFGRIGAVGTFAPYRTGTGTAWEYSSTIPAISTGIWKVVCMTFDTGAPATQKMKFYTGTSTSSIVSVAATAVTEGSGLYSADGENLATLGTNADPANKSVGGEYGFIMISTGILTLQDFQDQQFTPHVTTSTLLLAMVSTFNSTGTVRDLSGNGNTGSMADMTFSANGPPIYTPDGVGW